MKKILLVTLSLFSLSTHAEDITYYFNVHTIISGCKTIDSNNYDAYHQVSWKILSLMDNDPELSTKERNIVRWALLGAMDSEIYVPHQHKQVTIKNCHNLIK